jgi:hypothetical protein
MVAKHRKEDETKMEYLEDMEGNHHEVPVPTPEFHGKCGICFGYGNILGYEHGRSNPCYNCKGDGKSERIQ